MMRLLALHIAIIGCSLFSKGQQDSIKNNFLEEIILEDSRLQNLAVGHGLNATADTMLIGGHSSTFSEFLFSNHSNHIRSYGPGLSATFSSRGSSSSQVNLYWNNLPLNSPGLGSTDIGLLPSNGFSLTQVNGGGSTLYGNQAMGATVSVTQTLFREGESFRIGGGVGSFGKYFGNVSGKLHGKKWENYTSLNYQSSDNDFTYNYRNEEYNRKNADVLVLNITNDFKYSFSNRANLTVAYWGTISDRGSPSSYVPTAPANSRLEDENHKVVAIYNQQLKKGVISFTQGFLSEKQRFTDSNLDELNSTKNVVSKLSYSLSFSKQWSLFVGFDNFWTEATGENKTDATQNNFSGFGSLKYAKERLKAVLALRQEFIDAKTAPFSPSLGLEYEVLENLAVIGNVSYNFRYPSLNDKYWTVGGNPDLKPEQGWSGEAGLKYTHTYFDIEVTYYRQSVENFIQWIPVSGAIWSPQNVKEVSIEGAEASLELKYKVAKVNTGLNLGYLFNNSIVTKSSISGDASVGKQLIYNPQHKFTTSIYGQYKSFNLLFGSAYTGDVFARTDNSALSTLEHFNVLNAQASYILKLKKSSFELHIAVLNFTNENYQTIKNYPMPGINFTTGITLTI